MGRDELSEELRALLNEAHLTPERLSVDLHFGKDTVGRWIRGSSTPNHNTLARVEQHLSRLLGRPINLLVAREHRREGAHAARSRSSLEAPTARIASDVPGELRAADPSFDTQAASVMEIQRLLLTADSDIDTSAVDLDESAHADRLHVVASGFEGRPFRLSVAQSAASRLTLKPPSVLGLPQDGFVLQLTWVDRRGIAREAPAVFAPNRIDEVATWERGPDSRSCSMFLRLEGSLVRVLDQEIRAEGYRAAMKVDYTAISFGLRGESRFAALSRVLLLGVAALRDPTDANVFWSDPDRILAEGLVGRVESVVGPLLELHDRIAVAEISDMQVAALPSWLARELMKLGDSVSISAGLFAWFLQPDVVSAILIVREALARLDANDVSTITASTFVEELFRAGE
jgi:transcriptional regulator with XRE-family HTH domain